MEQAAVCVVATGDQTPDLSDQTLQNFDVVQTRSEAEALEASGAGAFLWLSSSGRLAPQVLEQCLWGLQSADWVTWRDTGDAPSPSLRDVAGPVGISRKAMEWPEPKPGGAVRRLPWKCVVGAAGRHTAESRWGGPSKPATPVRGHWLSRLGAHLENSGLAVWENWSRDPVQTALRALPLAWKEAVNRRASRPVFNLEAYQRFQPDASYVNGRFLTPLRYAVARRDHRSRLGLTIPDLGGGPAASRLLDAVDQIDRRQTELLLFVERSNDNSGKEAWLRRVDRIYEAGRLVEADDADRMVLSLAMNWDLDALVISNASSGYRLVRDLKKRLPALRTLDIAAGDDGAWIDLDVESVDSFDIRVATSESALRSLQQAGRPQQELSLIRDGASSQRARREDRSGAAAVGFIGPLTDAGGAALVPAIAGELDRLLGEPAAWVVAGAGPLEAALRTSLRGTRTRFMRDGSAAWDAVDVVVVPSEDGGSAARVLRASAYGKAVVAMDGEEQRELLGTECGVLVTGGRDGEIRLAEALAALVQDPKRVRAMGEAGAQRVRKRHSQESAAAEWSRVFAKLLGQPG